MLHCRWARATDGAARLARGEKTGVAYPVPEFPPGKVRPWPTSPSACSSTTSGCWPRAVSRSHLITPADRSVVATVINGGVPEVERAVAVADAAFREWSVLAPKDRDRFLPAIPGLQGVGHRPGGGTRGQREVGR
ncbi:MAG: hypothetical protein DMD49_10845 [Gemmatimonadetes bacterium]|nr:MAG: hypothetical protein DMD49_10845 [Gemmatimonadota bacterium]